MNLHNSTHLDTNTLSSMFRGAACGWPIEGLEVRVRYSRGAAFSGACYYQSDRIFINLGRANSYPYRLQTHIARPQSNRTHWWRELYSIDLADEYQLALFVFLHEFYHRLVKLARRNVRQKEARCDRFAVRELVDRFGAAVRDARGLPARRDAWDFQDLAGFVARARRPRRAARHPAPAARAPRPQPVHPPAGPSQALAGRPAIQLLLFE